MFGIEGLFGFLIACLVLVIVFYVGKLVVDKLTLPDDVKQIVLIMFSLVILIILIAVTTRTFHITL